MKSEVENEVNLKDIIYYKKERNVKYYIHASYIRAAVLILTVSPSFRTKAGSFFT